MATLVKIGQKRIINLDNVTEVKMNEAGRLSIYFNVQGAGGLPDSVAYEGDEAKRVFGLIDGLCQFEV